MALSKANGGIYEANADPVQTLLIMRQLTLCTVKKKKKTSLSCPSGSQLTVSWGEEHDVL